MSRHEITARSFMMEEWYIALRTIHHSLAMYLNNNNPVLSFCRSSVSGIDYFKSICSPNFCGYSSTAYSGQQPKVRVCPELNCNAMENIHLCQGSAWSEREIRWWFGRAEHYLGFNHRPHLTDQTKIVFRRLQDSFCIQTHGHPTINGSKWLTGIDGALAIVTHGSR